MEKFQKKGNEFYHKVTVTIIGAVRFMEIVLAGLILAAVLLNAYKIITTGDISHLGEIDHFFNYTVFQEFLSFILLLVVGLELAIMLIRHTAISIIEVMLYAVARKMLIYNTAALDMLLGVFTLAVLYGIKLYMLQGKPLFPQFSFAKKTSTPIELAELNQDEDQ